MRAQWVSLWSALLWVACTQSSPGAPGGDAGTAEGDGGMAEDDAGAPGDDPGMAGDEQVSGERLKIRALVNDDGSVIVDEEIIDTGANGAVCRPKQFSDGIWRCQPVVGSTDDCTEPPAAGAVTLAIEEVPVGDGLVARRFRGADGSRLRELSYFDLDHQTEVVLTGVRLGGSLDMPPANLTPPSADGAQVYYSKSRQACPGCARDLIGIDGCRLTDTTTYVRLGNQVFHTTPEDVLAYVRFRIEGEWFERGEVRHVLRLSAPSALDEWKQAARVLTGAGRYRIAGWQIGDTQRAYPPVALLFDSERQDESCWTFPEAGGGYRCLPHPSARIVYLDAACSTQAMAGQDGGNAPSTHYARGTASVDGGPPVSGIWSLGAGAAAPKLIYGQHLGGCLPVVSDARVGAWKVYPLGAQVPRTAFGTLHEALR